MVVVRRIEFKLSRKIKMRLEKRGANKAREKKEIFACEVVRYGRQAIPVHDEVAGRLVQWARIRGHGYLGHIIVGGLRVKVWILMNGLNPWVPRERRAGRAGR